MAASPKPAARKPRAAKPAARRPQAARPEAPAGGSGRRGAGRPGAAQPALARAGGAGPGRTARRVPTKVLAQFTSQLATLVNAGLPLVRSLRVLEGQQKSGPFQNVVTAVSDEVESGAPLSEALSKYPGVFDRLYVNMVRAGEAGGVLGTILERLATFAQKTQRIRSQLSAAIAYPAMVLIFAGLVVLVVMTFVVPKFQDIFESFNAEMPPATRVLMAISNSLVSHWYVWIGVPVLLFVGLVLGLRNERFARAVDGLLLRFPVTGGLVRKTTVARFTRTLGTLLSSGVPILESLTIVQASISNRVVEEAVADVYDAIREGDEIAPPLAESGVFDDVVVNMIEVGEETGKLDQMLMRIADNFEEEVDTEVTRVLKILEPTVIFVMAVGVGSIVISLFLPILRLMETFQTA